MSTAVTDALPEAEKAAPPDGFDPRDAPQVLVHFYRAGVQHADVWRQRLDHTTNWAVVTTAAVLTFAFGGAGSPHFVLLLVLVFDFFFLFMESRRYQAYNVWQRRIRTLHQHLIAPALRADGKAAGEGGVGEDVGEGLARLAQDLGRTVPRIPLWAALGYRIRRNYGPLVTIVILAWLLKLFVHPFPAVSWQTLVIRAHVGILPGPIVLGLVWLFFGTFIFLAIKAPSEQMRDWSVIPAPIERIVPASKRIVKSRDKGKAGPAEEAPGPPEAEAP